MQGLVNFVNDLAMMLGSVMPVFFYLAAIGWFMFGAWGLWQMAQPHNPFRGRPWIPPASILFSGASAAFDTILTKANKSAGSDLTVNTTGSLTSYTSSVDTQTLLGNSPGDAIVNIDGIFALFFACFGVACAFWAVVTWRAHVNGRSQRGPMSCFIQFVFGVVLINNKTVVSWIVNVLSVQG